jgi:pimeloyl-ACP methyl ester carboxylesterase
MESMMGFSRPCCTLLGLWLFGLWFASTVSAGTVSTGEAVWYDSARHRAVPVKFYFPHSATKAPVILFSHGLGSSIDNCAYLANAWTSHGFVCILVQHPGSDENIWKGKVRILNEFRGALEQNWNSRTRAEDLHFILNCLEQLAQSNERLAARIDTERIGVGGIDLGALAALLLAGQVPPDYGDSLYDPRIKAVLALSPPVQPMNISYREIYRSITAPTLFITGTKDDGIIGSTKAIHRRIPFDAMDQCQRYLIILDGGDHRIYGGRLFSFLGGRNDNQFQAGIARSSTYFWLAVLQNDPRAIRAMNGYGWETLVGVKALVERRVAQSVLLGGGSSVEIDQPNLTSE